MRNFSRSRNHTPTPSNHVTLLAHRLRSKLDECFKIMVKLLLSQRYRFARMEWNIIKIALNEPPTPTSAISSTVTKKGHGFVTLFKLTRRDNYPAMIRQAIVAESSRKITSYSNREDFREKFWKRILLGHRKKKKHISSQHIVTSSRIKFKRSTNYFTNTFIRNQIRNATRFAIWKVKKRTRLFIIPITVELTKAKIHLENNTSVKPTKLIFPTLLHILSTRK